MLAWLKKWLFVFSLSLALLIPFSVWLAKTLMWQLYLQAWDLPSGVYGLLTIAVAALLLIALGSIIRRPVPERPLRKVRHIAFLFVTLALNVICWWVIWVITNTSFT